ncbi:MAG TPA: glycosyltransferase [Aeromonadales bacterium]|nr:glycosyltransferase [Aeromonadales bacterium]
MKSDPLISVIIPCFNCQEFVDEAITSVLNQDYSNKEIIIVDDGSTDESEEIIKRYSENIKIIQQKNMGLSGARNSGINHARGEYIAFLDADDYWSQHFLSAMVEQAVQSKSKLIYCGWEHVGTYRQEPFVPPDYEDSDNKLELMIEAPRWPVHAAIVHKSIVDELGGFNESLNYCEDFNFWIRAATKNRISRVSKVLAYYRHHGDTQLSKSVLNMAFSHLNVQQTFLKEHQDIKKQLSRKQIRKITYGRLLNNAYKFYWKRELQYARPMFRKVMAHGYGSLSDWKYMLPSFLPLSWHLKLISGLGKSE